MAVDLLSLENALKRITTGMPFLEFLQELLNAVGYPQATFERARLMDFSKGVMILAKLYVQDVEDAHASLAAYTRADNHSREGTRIAIFYDGKNIGVENLQSSESRACSVEDFYKCARILTPLLGWRQEKSETEKEEATLTMAVAFAELYNDLIDDNPRENIDLIDEYVVRILYLCFLNGEGLLGNCELGKTFKEYTKGATGRAGKIVKQLFEILGGKVAQTRIAAFEGLSSCEIPEFKEDVNELTIGGDTCACLQSIFEKQWASVDIAVLGGIVQTIMDRGRGYRQVLPAKEYIDKLLGPLVLDEIRCKIRAARGNRSVLREIADQIRQIKLFDPSCSFGAILVGGYIRIVRLLREIEEAVGIQSSEFPFPAQNIYGIEAQDLPLKIAHLSFLWTFYQNTNGSKKRRLTLALKGLSQLHLIKGRAPRLNWSTICRPDEYVYVVSNPPYAGARRQSPEEKEDCVIALAGMDSKSGDLDLATCWAYLGAKYLIQGAAGCSLMTTNSIVQGVHAGEFWPSVFKLGVGISFAFTAFKLRPVVCRNAPGVTVVIVGLSKKERINNPKIITGHIARNVNEISPYLIPGHTIVKKTKSAVSKILPKMCKGNMPYDKGHLLIDKEDEYATITRTDPRVVKYLRRVVGSDEFIKEIPRWCIWVKPTEVAEAKEIPFFNERFSKCRASRLGKSDKAARKLANTPWRFREQHETIRSSIVVPAVSSENRAYIPVGFVGPETIVTNLAFVVYDCEAWLFGVLSSRMHNLWIRTVCGGLETRIRYSNELGYNTFPFPNISESQKDKITTAVRKVLIARELIPNATLGQKYDSPTDELMAAHKVLDDVIEQCYRRDPFVSDEDRLDYLMSMYDQMTEDTQCRIL